MRDNAAEASGPCSACVLAQSFHSAVLLHNPSGSVRSVKTALRQQGQVESLSMQLVHYCLGLPLSAFRLSRHGAG